MIYYYLWFWTGKTATIVCLILLAVRLGFSILVTSHTHSAIDNILLRLKGKVDFIRLGSSHRIHRDLLPYSEETHNCFDPSELEKFYNNKVLLNFYLMIYIIFALLYLEWILFVCLCTESNTYLQISCETINPNTKAVSNS